MKYHERQQELQRLKTTRIASTMASLIRDFWTRMTEAYSTLLVIITITVNSYLIPIGNY